jgi:hypothetical protein
MSDDLQVSGGKRWSASSGVFSTVMSVPVTALLAVVGAIPVWFVAQYLAVHFPHPDLFALIWRDGFAEPVPDHLRRAVASGKISWGDVGDIAPYNPLSYAVDHPVITYSPYLIAYGVSLRIRGRWPWQDLIGLVSWMWTEPEILRHNRELSTKTRNVNEVLMDHGYFEEIENDEGEVVEKRLTVRYDWATDPGVGDATAENPARLRIQKTSDLKKSRLESEDFWSQIHGVRRLEEVRDAGQAWELVLLDTEPELPAVSPSDLTPLSNLRTAEVPLGIDERKQELVADFEQRPHLLIGGGSGSGKSVLGRWVLTVLSYQNFETWTIDPDGDFSMIDTDRSAVLPDDRLDLLHDLEETLEERISRGQGSSFRPFVLLVDEWDDAIASYNDNLSILERVANRGRKYGMLLVALSQEPSADKFPFRKNIGWRVIGRSSGGLAREVITADGAQEKLKQISEPGEFLASNDQGEARIIRAPYSDDLDVSSGGSFR